MKAPSTGKLKRFDNNLSASFDDLAPSFFQGFGIQHNECAALHRLRAHGKSAAQAPVEEARIVRAIVGKGPTKHGGIEALGCLDVGGRKLNVIHLEVMFFWVHVLPRVGHQRARLAHRLSSALRIPVRSPSSHSGVASLSCTMASAPA